MNIDEPGRLVDFIASSLPSLSTPDKQDTLETLDINVRLDKINQHLAKRIIRMLEDTEGKGSEENSDTST